MEENQKELDIIAKWESTGLIEGISGDTLVNTVIGLEFGSIALMKNSYSVKLELILFPIIRRILEPINSKLSNGEILKIIEDIIPKLNTASNSFYQEYEKTDGFPMIDGVDVEAEFCGEFAKNYEIKK